jgi:hypothetical protein
MRLPDRPSHWRARSGVKIIPLIDGDAYPSANAGASLFGWQNLSEFYTRHGQMPKVRALYEKAKDPAAKAAVLVASAEVLAQAQ